MKKKTVLFALCFMCVSLFACGTKNDDTIAPKTQSSTTTVNEQTIEPTETAQPSQTETTISAQTEQTETSQPVQTDASQPETTENTSLDQGESNSEVLTEAQALDAIKNYCFTADPNLKNMADSGEYNIYWTVTTNNANEIVVLYRAYTGAQIRYYIDTVSGETYVTELVPGIIDEEQRTDESFNVKKYLA